LIKIHTVFRRFDSRFADLLYICSNYATKSCKICELGIPPEVLEAYHVSGFLDDEQIGAMP
jgi:hypothetical protein